MSEGSWVRLTAVPAKVINDQIEAILQRKAESVTKNPELRKAINEIYLEVVTPYVPLSDKDKPHHLRNAYITKDGRIIWSAVDRGYNYADVQYRPEEYEVNFVNYTTPGTGPHWTDKVQPGTDDWDNEFIPRISELIIQTYKNG